MSNQSLDKKKNRSKFTYYGRIVNKNFEGHNNWIACEQELLKKRFLLRKFFFKNSYPISIMNAKRGINFIINKLRNNREYLGRLEPRKN